MDNLLKKIEQRKAGARERNIWEKGERIAIVLGEREKMPNGPIKHSYSSEEFHLSYLVSEYITKAKIYFHSDIKFEASYIPSKMDYPEIVAYNPDKEWLEAFERLFDKAVG